MDTELLLEDLTAKKDNKRAVQMSRYMRNQFDFLGVPAKLRKEIAKPYMTEAKKDNEIIWEFVDTFWESKYRECQYIVNDYLNLKKELLVPEDISKLRALALTKPWWDTIDALDRPVADIARRYPEVNDILLEWSVSDSIWLRRISIIHQRLRKEKTNLDLLEKVIINNLNHDEFFINKGIGWALRSYSRTDAEWVRAFIDKYEDDLSRLSIREGSKYL